MVFFSQFDGTLTVLDEGGHFFVPSCYKSGLRRRWQPKDRKIELYDLDVHEYGKLKKSLLNFNLAEIGAEEINEPV